MAVTWVERLADCRHERVLIGFLRGPHPHPLQRRVQLGSPESHRPADFEIRNQSGHAPAVEVAFAHAEVGAGVFFGEEWVGGLFGARRISWLVHAGVGRVNLTDGDKW